MDEMNPNMGTGLHIMIITYDEESGRPEIDLGDLPPYVALSILGSIIEALEYIMPSPKIILHGQTILDPYVEIDTEDGEDD